MVSEWKEHVSMATSIVLQSRADQVLRQSPIPALRQLSVKESDLDVVLSGSVPSYYLKQLAQETIMPVLGSRELHNQVMVIRS
jgi:osmotically-inducible protein OsmY